MPTALTDPTTAAPSSMGPTAMDPIPSDRQTRQVDELTKVNSRDAAHQMSPTRRQDIVIVGGGIVGVCTAFFIVTDPSFDCETSSVTLVEDADIAYAASGYAAGFLALDWHGPRTSSLAKLSYDLHKSLASTYQGASRWQYRQMDSLGLTIRVPKLDDGRTARNEEIEGNPALEGSAFRPKPESKGERESERDPWLDRREWEEERSIYGTMETTAQVHPRLFTRHIFSLARESGVKFLRGRPVSISSPTPSDADPATLIVQPTAAPSNRDSDAELSDPLLNGPFPSDWATTSPDDTNVEIPCTSLVLCAGPWTSQVASTLGITSDLPISNLPGHSILIRPRPSDASFISPTAVFSSIYIPVSTQKGSDGDDGKTTTSPEIFPRPDGTVYVAGENNAERIPASARDAQVQESFVKRLIRAAGCVSKVLERGEVVRKQLCYRPVTPDGAPIVGRLEGKRQIFVAAGHGPWGITLGPGTGKVMAELVLFGQAKSANIYSLQSSRFA